MNKKLLFQCRHYMTQFVFDTAALEDSPFTLPEVQTLLDGITVGGHTLSEQNLVLNQKASWEKLFGLIETERFAVTKEVACGLQDLVAKEEALEWGCFRTGNVRISGTEYTPPKHENLDARWNEMIGKLGTIQDTKVRACSLFLQMARNQFFWDGNKRTGRLMMNGALLSEGIPPILVPAKAKLEFNNKMIRFCDSGNESEMIDFLAKYHVDFG
ncbi:Fic family protein [Microbulbifer sp. 2304DJ12-6]|uniref:Fic family protein n=1 Tax=Microbulbifer sp. 2304DJ12-6 TaxID=3233340 RepID=UPI0039AF7729